jgi:class 3 adenylate cyclase
VLEGGLSAWIDARNPLAPVRDPDASLGLRWSTFSLEDMLRSPEVDSGADSPFLPRIAGQAFLEGHELPIRREMVVLFVDMVQSTQLVLERSPEEVLALMQAFMEVVIDIGAYHCGDVHDFEGDGALLYFEGAGEAVPAAFRLRDELARRRATLPELPLPRLSLDIGPVVIGVVGTRFRQTVSIVGPCVHRAARILRAAPPEGIVITGPVLDRTQMSNPELAPRFELLPTPEALRAELGELEIFVAASGPIPARSWRSRSR